VPTLVNGRGNFPIEKSFGYVDGSKVGLIRVSSGTRDKKTFERLLDMLVALKEMGRADLLLDIKERRRRPLELLKLYRKQKLADLSDVNSTTLLEPSLAAWLALAVKKNGEGISDRTRKSYRNNFRQLMRVANASCDSRSAITEWKTRDLPQLLLKYRDACVKHAHFTPFNQAKCACLAFARGTESERQYSTLYRNLAKIDGLSTKRKRDRKALRFYQVRALMDEMSEPNRTHLWNFVITGMRLGEMSSQWTIAYDRITIPGTKTAAAARIVPRIGLLTRVPFAKSTFLQKLRVASKGGVSPLDLRATYARLLEEAKIPESRIDAYFGHSRTRSVKAGYRTQDVGTYLVEDAKLLAAQIDKDDAPPPGPTLEEAIPFMMHMNRQENAALSALYYDPKTGKRYSPKKIARLKKKQPPMQGHW